ncbi:PHD finger protein ALFIN-LIKE 4-like isoform X2 [Solanum dulcamara]|uniref:PHD finger protein ALFIN-LIKE 4-like isoform X2 n=1 Tax=Solanum dulcamara TaxID=45834 RepID=UPI002485ACF2|nr:PHD finger protein ALFIN-LIKE 4-like isoform X2 [Solanum dulcamara]
MEFGAKLQKKNKALDVFKNFKGRHAGLIKALTTDVEEFFKQCDPEKENLCLYGLPNERWVVNLPAEDSPPGLPEPVLGINFARDGMQLKEWLSFVAYHSDAWLLAVAFYAGARFGLGKADRKKLFDMINDLPTIHEVVTGVPKTQQKEKSTVSNQSKNKSKPNASKASESQVKFRKLQHKYEEDDDDDDEGEEDEEDEEEWGIEKDVEEEQGETLCGLCGGKYAEDEFWICCDHCETWFHGQCVKITPAMAEYIKQYKCPPCSSKRSRTPCTEY